MCFVRAPEPLGKQVVRHAVWAPRRAVCAVWQAEAFSCGLGAPQGGSGQPGGGPAPAATRGDPARTAGLSGPPQQPLLAEAEAEAPGESALTVHSLHRPKGGFSNILDPTLFPDERGSHSKPPCPITSLGPCPALFPWVRGRSVAGSARLLL